MRQIHACLTLTMPDLHRLYPQGHCMIKALACLYSRHVERDNNYPIIIMPMFSERNEPCVGVVRCTL